MSYKRILNSWHKYIHGVLDCQVENDLCSIAYLQGMLTTDVHARLRRIYSKGLEVIELCFSSSNYWGLE